MKKKPSLFAVVNTILMILLGFVCTFPFYQVFVTSFVSFREYLSSGGLILFPKQWTIQAYTYIFRTDAFPKSLLITTIATTAGTALSMALTVSMAYPLSKNNLRGKKFFSYFIIIPMMFSGGIVPLFLLMRDLKLLNQIWALILPWCLSTFNIILMRNYYISLPESLEESAKLDGANDLVVLFRILIPLCMPIVATLALFYGVGYWNDYIRCTYFITKTALYPMQNLLRQILVEKTLASLGKGMHPTTATDYDTAQTIKMAIIMVATVPIVCVYPFLQKHYVKGIMLGAIKG